MLAAPVAVVDSAALVAQVLVDRVVPAQPLVPAPLSQEAELPALVPQVLVGLAQLPVLVHRVVEAAVPRDLLSRLSRQSFSAAMARTTSSPAAPPYEPVPRSR